MRTIIKFIFISILLLNTSLYAAEDQPGNFRLMVGIAEGLRPLSYRIGFGSTDFGILNSGTIGITTHFSSNSFYISLGPAYIATNSSAGLFGAVGTDFKFFNFIYLKTELNTSISIKNYSVGSGMVGLGIYW